MRWHTKNDKYEVWLFNVPTIDTMSIVDDYDDLGGAVHRAVRENNIEGLKLLLSVPNISLNIVINKLNNGLRSVVHVAVERNNIEALKLLLSHPNLTSGLNERENYEGLTPVMLALRIRRLKHLALLAAHPRIDLDIPQDRRGRTLVEVARWTFLLNSLHHMHWYHQCYDRHHCICHNMMIVILSFDDYHDLIVCLLYFACLLHDLCK